MSKHLTQTPPTPPKWLQCNGQQIRKLARAGMLWLEQNEQTVNDMNVFPVPDGDTGTNMLLTMQSAFGRVKNSDETHVGKMLGQIAHGALMGARGNSGVILSQIWRGLARPIKEKETFNAKDLAEAFQSAADTAYGGVMRPVEGTILTVIREAAEEAQDAASKSDDLRFVLERAIERARQSLERTPDLLPILKQAGVVDSGGQGLVYMLEGMLLYSRGELRTADMDVMGGKTAVSHAPAQAFAIPEGGTLEFPYDVQFILMGENLNVTEVRDRIDSMGDSTVVVGDETTIKVHIHVSDPGEPLSYGISMGKIDDVVVENMQVQMETIINQQKAAVPTSNIQPGQIGVVTVAPGSGIADAFRSLHAAFIVDGGQTNNPSTEDIFQAIQDVPTNNIILLPNNKNIIMAAEAARELSSKNVSVVPSRTVPQGMMALMQLDLDGDLDEVTAEMRESLDDVATGEITRAVRSVTLDGVTVEDGEFIGMVNGRLFSSGSNMRDVIAQTLSGMEMDDREIVTIYYGDSATKADAEIVSQQIESLYEEVETEIIPGHQPHYYYILGAE